MDDLAGLLAGPGHLVVAHGMARVSTVVAEVWRVGALTAELEARDLAPSTEPTDAGTSVRTTFSPRLGELLALWTRGATRLPPRGLTLGGGALRLWCIAAGDRLTAAHRLAADDRGDAADLMAADDRGAADDGPAQDPPGWQLGLTADPAGWPTIGAALADIGLTATLVGPRAGGPAYRLAGTGRVRRLAELVGEAPLNAPAWPA